MKTTEANKTVQGGRPGDTVRRPGPLPKWILRASKDWALDTYRPYALGSS
jgi:hypothetical protein